MPGFLFVKKAQSLHTSDSEAAARPSTVLVTCNLCALHFPKIPSSFIQAMRKKCGFIVIALSIRRQGLKTNLIGLQAIWTVMEKTLN